ncbi:MAG: PDZ domain-containing protein [Planctomycetes bacterium]|nr:PDZ domain-containing protein [Planctomycetota bacterium]
MNKYTLFALIVLAAFITSCTTITTEIPKAPAKVVVPTDRTIFTKDAWLGIVGKPVANGVEVTDIYVNSSAKESGIKKGDIIVGCDGIVFDDGIKIANIESLLSAISQKKAGDAFKIKALRQAEIIEIINSISNTTMAISKEEFLKKYQGFKDGGNPGDKMEFTALKKIEDKEFTVTLGSEPNKFHLIEPSKPPTEPKPEIKDGKKAGWMGISMGPVKGLATMGMAREQGGIKINSVSPASPAEQGGLKTGDIVISYDGNTFSGEEPKYQEKMAEHIKAVGSGGIVSLNILRAADEIELMINDKKEPTESDPAKAGGEMKDSVSPSNITDVINNLKVGDVMKAGITRNIKNISLKITLGTRMAASDKPEVEPETNDQIHPELMDYTTPIEQLAKRIISDTNITDKYEDLLKRYSDDQKNADDFRLRDMRYLQRDPFKIPNICDTLIDNLQKTITYYEWTLVKVIDELDEGIVLCSRGGRGPFTPELKTGISLQEQCNQIEELLKRAEGYRKRAFAGLTEGDMAFLKDNIYGLTDRWILDSNFEMPETNERDRKLLQLCGYVNYRKLFTASNLLAGVLLPSYLDGLKKDIEREAGDKEGVLFSKDTPFGKIIIGGKGNDRYQENAAVIIDIGGDDFYANQQGGSVYETGKPDQPFSIIIDFAGNDRYSSYRYGCQGAGVMGVGILYDGAGDDIYIAQDWAQGSGLLGVGILVDADGEDSYKGQEYVQGCGLFGIGILIDKSKTQDESAGANPVRDPLRSSLSEASNVPESEIKTSESELDTNQSLTDDDIFDEPEDEDDISNGASDSYQANKFAQGFAGPKGFGLLIDTAGDDNYLASTKHPNGYPDNPGTFDGWSQGCGTGMRAYTDPSMSRSGGIGVLIDQAGDDYYEAGTFSQGGGYYFGWGMLADEGGNDEYLGTRYAQGFAAHSAIGYFIDESGDDQYRTLCGVVAGLSWDLTCVAFIDKAGNDTYDAGGFSRGASAHNGFCLFMDLGGKDIYKDSVALAGGNTYHGGYSLSIFLDKGLEENIYPKTINDKKMEVSSRVHNSIEVNTEYSIFIDTDKELEDLLKDDSYKGILKNNIKEETKEETKEEK